MSEEHGGAISDEDTDDDAQFIYKSPRPPPELQGTIFKWTNYIHGWQKRYLVLKDGTLSYYKSENETSFGCRGSISVQKAVITPHEIDECRFDICLNDSVWYLRVQSEEERQHWVDSLEQHKVESVDLHRHGSAHSLTSASFSATSESSNRRSNSNEVAEDGNTEAKSTCFPNHQKITPEILEKHGSHALDFRGEALTFKATTAGILTTLGHCVDVMSQRDECFKRRLEREVEKRKKLEERLKQALSQSSMTDKNQTKYVVVGGPDYEEGPHSVIGEDEFYDAVESALDKMEEEEEFRERLRQRQLSSPSSFIPHPLSVEIDRLTMEQLHHAQESVESGVWQIFAEEGEMKMYRRELEEDGLVIDPLKAVHHIKGVTAHEMTYHFWSPDTRFEWDTSIEQMTVLDRLSEDTLIFLQIHKRVWPIAQRDALFWSHIRKILPDHPANEGAYDTWIVCNHSTEHPEGLNDGKCIRIILTVCFVCQTFLPPGAVEGKDISRDDLSCKITYCSWVNPGGWAPSSVLRAVYKREYPKFLKRFTQYVQEKCDGKPIAFNGLKPRDYKA